MTCCGSPVRLQTWFMYNLEVSSAVTNQGIGPRWTDTEPPCYKGNKRRTRPFSFPTGLGPDGPREIHAVTLYFSPQSVGMSSTEHGKVVPQLDDCYGTTCERLLHGYD